MLARASGRDAPGLPLYYAVLLGVWHERAAGTAEPKACHVIAVNALGSEFRV
jgi:hypothetical protein